MSDLKVGKLAAYGVVGLGAIALSLALDDQRKKPPNLADASPEEPLPSRAIAIASPAANRQKAYPLELSFQNGSGNAVQTTTGSVVSSFTLARYDKRHRLAMYALRIANNSSAALICSIWVISHEGIVLLAYPVSFEIEPFSTKSAEVPVRLDDHKSFQRAIAKITGHGVHCLVEAAAPVRQSAGRSHVAIAAAGLAAALLASAAFSIAAAPRIGAFAAPPMALAGTTVEAEYSASGAGSLEYTVTAPDGRRIQGGALAERSGEIPIAIPPSSDSGAYTLQLTMRGPFGNAKEMRVLNSVAPGNHSGARISDVSVNPVVAKPGQTIAVAYSASATGGYVRLAGSDGAVWAQKPFSHAGLTTFVVPPVLSSREMRVLLHVTKGRSAAESSAGLVVVDDRVKAPKTILADNSDPAAAADAGKNGTFEVAGRNKSGGAISVRILSPRNGMRISLTDTQSHEITGANVGSDQESVTLRAPNVAIATRYTVVAAFTDGFGQESIVEPITVAP